MDWTIDRREILRATLAAGGLGMGASAHPMDPAPSPYGVDVPVMIGTTKDDMTLIMYASPWFGSLDDAGLVKMGTGLHGKMAP